MKRWLRKEALRLMRSNPVRIAVGLYIWTLAGVVAAGLANADLRASLAAGHELARILLLAALLPWAAARATDRRGPDLVLEASTAAVTPATALVAKAMVLAGLAAFLVLLSAPFDALVSLAGSGGGAAARTGLFLFGVVLGVASLHVHIGWRNLVGSLAVSWALGAMIAILYLATAAVATGPRLAGWALAAALLVLVLISRGNREFVCLES